MSAPGYPVPSAPGEVAGARDGSAAAAAPPGHVRVHSVAELLRAGVPGATRDTPGPGASYLDALWGVGSGLGVGIGDEVKDAKDRERETFPPLVARNPSLSSLARFAESRAAAAGLQGNFTGAKSGAALLWGVLRAMSAHADPAGGDPHGPGADVRALLLGEDAAIASEVTEITIPASAPDIASRERALAESERLLLSGRRGEALDVLTRADLWAPASLLASRMGAAFERDVAARAARATTPAGSPLRTLALVLAGAARDLLSGHENHETGEGADDARALLPRWREHLAVLAANAALAPEDSRRVMAALGDALLAASRDFADPGGIPTEPSDAQSANALANAHAAFALAGVAPSPFHPAARLCLLGADHARAPRTYHSDPRAIQATLLLERAVCGGAASGETRNACFASFQPYKVHYAGLLAEAGATREALALVESVSKTLRGRDFLASAGARDGSLNVPLLAQLAGETEHRLRGHARGGLGGLGGLRDLGSAATTLFGGFGKMFDKGVQKVFGDEGGGGGEASGSGVVGRLISHSRAHSGASVEDRAPRDAGGDAGGVAAHSRGGSFASDGSGSAHGHSVPESGASPSRGSGSVWRQFSGVLGKVGAAIPLPKPKNQAKLGEENTMYYDEKLGRWVEPGKEGEAEAGPPPPPPTTLGASPIPSGTGAAGTAHTAAAPGGMGTGPSPGAAAAAAPFSMRAQKGRSKYVDAFSLSGPAAAEHAAAAAARDPSGAVTPGGQQSVFPPGLMPPGVGVGNPGLFPPGVPGAFSGGGAPGGSLAALMVPSPAPGAGFGEALPSADLAPLPLSPAAGARGEEREQTTLNRVAAIRDGGGDDAFTEPPDFRENREDARGARDDDEDRDGVGGPGDDDDAAAPAPDPQIVLKSAPPGAAIALPPVAPMKDLRLTDAPDRDGIKDALSPSYGDGRVADPPRARFSPNAHPQTNSEKTEKTEKTFFLPGPAAATGVVGGGATADDADDTVEADGVDTVNAFVSGETACEPLATADDPFADSTGGFDTGFDDGTDASARGYFDREGVWRLGDWPGGELDADGRWHEGYWTQERFWVAGYWDETGAWREGARPGGHFDARAGWVADGGSPTHDALETLPGGSLECQPNPTTSAADVADALGTVAGLGSKFGGEARDDSDEMTEIGL